MKPDTHTLEKVLEEGKVFKTRYKTKSKNKTFEKGTDVDDIVDHLLKTIEQWPHFGETKYRYLITITKIEDGRSSEDVKPEV